MVEVAIFSRKDKGQKDKRTFGNGRHHWRLAYFRTGHRYRKWLARLVEPRTICSAEASHPVALLTPTPFPNSLGRQSINPSSTVTVTDHWEWWSWTSTVRNGNIALPEIVWFVFGYSNHQPINGKWTRHSSAIYNGHPLCPCESNHVWNGCYLVRDSTARSQQSPTNWRVVKGAYGLASSDFIN